MASKIDERPSLTLTPIYEARPEEVWSAWTDPEALMQWFGPDAGKVSAAELDVRAGGRYHVAFSTLVGDGTEFIVRHEHFFDTEARDRHEGGWAGSLDKLERFLNRAD